MADLPDRTEDASWAYLGPSDLRAHDLPVQAALGFHRGSTEELLARAADTIERLNSDLAAIRQAKETWKRERDRLEAQLEEAKTRAELLVGEAMLDAHRAGQALRAEAEAEAEAVRRKAEALLAPAKQEAQRLVAEAQEQANNLISDAEAEVERLSAQAEQYKLLAADVHHRTAEFLRRGLEALGADPADWEAPHREEVAPFAGQTGKQHANRPNRKPATEQDLQPISRPSPQPIEELGFVTTRVPREATSDEGNDHPPRRLALVPSPGNQTHPPSHFADDPMTRLWRDADSRDTGHRAVEAIRARRLEGNPEPDTKRSRLARIRL